MAAFFPEPLAEPAGDMIQFESGGRQASLPAEVVVCIARATAAAAMPFTGDSIEGIVFHESGPTLQLDLTRCWGGPACRGPYSLLVRTGKGPVMLRVDGVSSGGFARSRVPPSALSEVEERLGAFVAADAIGYAPQSPGPRPAGEPELISLLVVEAGGVLVAFPAPAVLRVGRHESCVPVRGGVAGERLVTLAGETLAGYSLGCWLGTPGSGAEPWGLVLDCGDGRVAVTVAAIHAMTAVQPRDMQTVSLRRGSLVCFLDSERGLVEVVDPGAFAESRQEPVEQARSPSRSREPRAAAAAPALEPERRRGLGSKNGVTAQTGAYSCVFPPQAALRIFREAELRRTALRGPGTLPVLDLAVLLGAGAGNRRHALQLRRNLRRSALILADHIAPLSPDVTWYPLPIVPPMVREMFEAVGQEGDRCHFLVRENNLDYGMNRVVSGLGTCGLTGWARVFPLDDEAPVES